MFTRLAKTPPVLHSATTRRSVLRAAVAGTAATTAVALAAPGAGAAPAARPRPEEPRPSTPAQALLALNAGNRRWRTFREQHPHETEVVRRTLVDGQHPFAIVLGCIDSRVAPELVFDQGLGDLMTVRTAGEVLDEAVRGSIAYGVLELGIPLVVVLGHQSCGAVSAAVDADESGELLPAHIQYLADEIKPAIDRTKTGAARKDSTINANVSLIRGRLAADPDLAAKIADGSLAVVGARYELNTQLVHQI
ncbi:carbonic anhydrase [Streptomyces sp. NBC_01317]|uniref:carbonic anhydrase n=1 Tax=Streptomyces sp. NBC_01317 TaxID=2903822 RepID=UPI002E0F0EC0|nr:carbonic anhydrase [Streptomyces sp. NBC_01317]